VRKIVDTTGGEKILFLAFYFLEAVI